LLVVGLIEGAKSETNFAPVLLKNLSIIGSTLRSRSDEEIYELAQSLRSTIWPMFKDGKIKPVIDSYFDFREAKSAHEKMKNFEHSGKIILKMT